MTQVSVGENEGIESALRRIKGQVSKAGIFGELKRLRHNETLKNISESFNKEVELEGVIVRSN